MFDVKVTGGQRAAGLLVGVECLRLLDPPVRFASGEFRGVSQPVRRGSPAGVAGDVTAVGLSQDPAAEFSDLGLQLGEEENCFAGVIVPHRPRRVTGHGRQIGLDIARSSHDRVIPIQSAGVLGHVSIPALSTDTPTPKSGLSTNRTPTRE
ncbi:hypothetical protein GCM10027020_23930 [Nocardioides salsibiostraticola]